MYLGIGPYFVAFGSTKFEKRKWFDIQIFPIRSHRLTAEDVQKNNKTNLSFDWLVYAIYTKGYSSRLLK